jgi:carbonic anhydrase
MYKGPDVRKSFNKMLAGYEQFRKKYASGDKSIMQYLSRHGQKPHTMVIACCDSRVDPALILQCDPGDLFVVRNVANIVPPYEKDTMHHGTSAALEFGISFLKVKHLVLFGHSQCGGVNALLKGQGKENPNDFILNWVSLIKMRNAHYKNADEYAQLALRKSHKNCLTFPWLKERVDQKKLLIHLWFFDIKSGKIFSYSQTAGGYEPLHNAE